MWSRVVKSQVKHNSYFIVGMAVGLWVSLAVIPLEEEAALCPLAGAPPSPAGAAGADEFEPRREDKPLGSGVRAAGRSVQRPRYYSTELGMRGSLLTGVLTSEEALKTQVPALNRSLARLQPALKFFITASAMSQVPGLANVVGFTDTREMLKPFHALKYLADNFLEEYDFFFLATDAAFVDARRLTELVSRLSVSQDLHMGVPAPGGSDYCDLDSGVILSNSVLRAVHAELEWCVRNSYSPLHRENLGRCVLHAAHRPCAAAAQGERYEGVVVASAAPAPARLAQLRAGAARAALQRGRAAARRLRAELWRLAARHPAGYRNGTWPAGLRRDPGLAAPRPDSRFSHLRWTLFNATHAYMPDEVRAAAPLDAAAGAALALVRRRAAAWAARRWPAARRVALVEGAWQWEPAAALRYRLLLRLTQDTVGGGGTLRAVEVVRPLGAARLVPVRYVTESARVWLVVAVPRGGEAGADAAAFLQRYEQVALQQDKNTNLYVVSVGPADNATDSELRAGVAALAARHAGASAVFLQGAPAEEEGARAALRAVEGAVPRDALVLLAPPHLEFNQDFLNRVRMNTIPGEQWFLPLPFARHSQYAHPRFRAPGGGKPQVHTGRFPRVSRAPLLAAYKADLERALARWRGDPLAPLEEALAAAPLRCVRAPEPGCVLAPRGAPCAGAGARECLRALEGERFSRLDLGARTALAQLLLETESDAAD